MIFNATRHQKQLCTVFSVLIITLIIANINCHQQQQNPYDVLQIHHSSNQQEVKSRFRELSKVYHPDKLKLQNLSDDLLTQSQSKFQQIASAYEFIKSKDFNSKIVNQFYYKPSQSDSFQSPYSYNTYEDLLSSEIFREFHDFQYSQKRAKEEEKLRKMQGDGLYAKMMDFVRYMIRYKVVTIAVFFVSLGMFSIFLSYKQDENQKNKTNTRPPCGRNIKKS